MWLEVVDQDHDGPTVIAVSAPAPRPPALAPPPADFF